MTMTTTTFDGRVLGSFPDPRRNDSRVKVLCCEDGSLCVACGGHLEHANEGDEIHYSGTGDADSGYEVFADSPDRTAGEKVAAYITVAFFGALAADEWHFHTNGDVGAGLCHIGSIGDDGTLNLAVDLEECGLQWDEMTDLAREACEEQIMDWDPSEMPRMCFYWAEKLLSGGDQ